METIREALRLTQPSPTLLSVLEFCLLLCVLLPAGAGGIGVSRNCSAPLGMEDGRIGDDQISATSSYEPNLVGPANARVHSERGGGAWCPKPLIDDGNENPEFLEIDLLQDHVIRNISSCPSLVQSQPSL